MATHISFDLQNRRLSHWNKDHFLPQAGIARPPRVWQTPRANPVQPSQSDAVLGVDYWGLTPEARGEPSFWRPH